MKNAIKSVTATGMGGRHQPIVEEGGGAPFEIEGDNHHSLPEHPSLEHHDSSPNAGPSTFLTRFLFVSIVATAAVVFSVFQWGGPNSVEPNLFPEGLDFAPLPSSHETITSIAFGSCNHQDFPQVAWDTIASMSPNITILAGDNVYADCASIESCPNDLKRAYEKQMSNPSFMGAMKMLPVIATLDDHDYGMSSANRFNPYKDLAKEYFFDFFDIPSSDERRQRTGVDGVYTSFMYGDEEKGLVQIILLDTRYSRSKIGDVEENMLGDAQWDWLQDQFSQTADVRLLVSSVQVIATGHPFECWYVIAPKEQRRLYDLIGNSSNKGTTILLSGDRHLGGIYRHSLNETMINGKTSSIIEITASSFTHTLPIIPDSKYCHTPGGSTSEECDDPDPERLKPYVRVNHFGSISIDWNARLLNATLARADATGITHPHHNRPDNGEALQKIEIQF